FLAPLALMSMVDPRLNKGSRIYVDGLPLDLASKMLPWKSKFKPGLAMHIHMHAKAQAKYTVPTEQMKQSQMSRFSLLGLIDSLASTVKGLNWTPAGTIW